MDEKKIEPTQAMVDAVESARELVALDARTIMRAALNHPDAPGLFECDHTDYVHVDEAATRVEAGREEGWDNAVTYLRTSGGIPRVSEFRKANPYRPARTLPPERDGVVLVPADGHEAITTADGQAFSRLTFTMKQGIWYGPNLAQLGEFIIQTTSSSRLTPGTWKVEGE